MSGNKVWCVRGGHYTDDGESRLIGNTERHADVWICDECAKKLVKHLTRRFERK